MSGGEQRKSTLVEREAAFWDRHEEQIESLYARPHDWRLAPEVANRIVAPKLSYLRNVLRRYKHEVRSLLDIGCGNGWFCLGATAFEGIRAIGVDVSSKKVEAAKRDAERRGLMDRCEFHACDVMALSLPHKVDLLTAQGSLHHFPDLEAQLPMMVERFLRPGGLMLFVEPHHEGMPPGLHDRLVRLVHRPLLGKLFDLDFYNAVAAQNAAADPDRGEHAVRIESPAGREFLGAEPEIGKLLKARYPLLEERYFLYSVGHLTNAFYVFMKSRLVRALWRATLGFWVWRDGRQCRDPGKQEFAEEGAWLLRAPE